MADKKERGKNATGKHVTIRGKPPTKPAGPAKSNASNSKHPKTVSSGVDNQGSVSEVGKQNWNKIMTSREQLIQSSHADIGTAGGLEVPHRPDADRRRSSVASQLSWASHHRDSIRGSVDSRFSQVDITNLQTASAQDGDDKKDKSQPTTSNDSYTRSAIPYMPLPVAVVCFLLNTILPGVGTMLCGLCILCCGKVRMGSKEGTPMTALYVNMMVGTAQLFTVTFMLVGWFWSFTWGIYMVILAVEYRKDTKARKEKEIQAKALTAMSGTVRPWTLKTS